MQAAHAIDFRSHLPPYRSLLNPTARYDYRTHSLVPISQNEMNLLSLNLRMHNNHNLSLKSLKSSKTPGSSFKMKYKSLLSDVSRTLSIRLSNPYLLGGALSQFSSNGIPLSATLTSSSKESTQSPRAVPPPPPPRYLRNLPLEIWDFIFFLVDDKADYRNSLYTCKLFYLLAKPYYYEHIAFTSTYRVAQFISYLRLNSEVGRYVKTLDLSGVQPGFIEDQEEPVEEPTHGNAVIRFGDDELGAESNEKILAGWRDWKFKNNPLYSVHHSSSVSLTKIASNSQILTSSTKSMASSGKYSTTSKRFSKPFKYFREKKRRRSLSSAGEPNSRKLLRPDYGYADDAENHGTSSNHRLEHPTINKFLMNYSSSKDIPVGYVLHLINLCPNVESLNLGNLSLSIDYEISRSMIYKYQTFDLMNNYPKALVKNIDDIMSLDDGEDALTYEGSFLNAETFSIHNTIANSNTSIRNGFANGFKPHQPTSSASSVYSLGAFAKPILKYNSLLPPLPQTVTDISYLNKGDGKVYLSDLNLKSINNNYLRKVNEEELLTCILRAHGKNQCRSNNCLPNLNCKPKLKYLNLSFMIWLNKKLSEKLIRGLLCDHVLGYSTEDSLSLATSDEVLRYKQDLVIDFTDSGMYKNLQWAKRIDLNTIEGCDLADKIIKDNLYDQFEEFTRMERIRRGRMGENFLA
ncbi:uncharacterized protein CANTADRAFT_92398 [Suhomyces tanzawaensis NRRL Y-17324]|uniref:Uncharacterized protein n=1 Tax=Suhomyces tanzawaensis NRRL Y-17324 TaxID=984487 RepID=A0A1E4SBC5_9ASCO|nr:uncharacterized protein CANTADRAFT_92398 [Suhomyces tanzawaensis NRRL Y-17324]ODV76814.1 hypothetical protein CANTADRAFT_92398 [Suhomyces tanzawaensis NRRL Y-17324]